MTQLKKQKSKTIPFRVVSIIVIFVMLFIFPFNEKKFDESGKLIREVDKWGIVGIKKVVKGYSRDGNINNIDPFIFNMRHGKLTMFYNESTQIRFSIEYSFDKIITVIEMYDERGRDLDFGSIVNGNGILNVYYGSGKLVSSGMIVDGYKEGVWYHYNNAGLSDSTIYDKGRSMLFGKEVFFNIP